MNSITTSSASLAGSAAVFPAQEFHARAAALQARIRQEGADALLLTGPENIFWVSGRQTAGYFAFQALLVPADGTPLLLVRQLEETGARADVWFDDIHTWQDGQDPAVELARLLRGQGISRLATERAGWFVSPQMMGSLEAALGGIALVDGSGWVERLRMVKSPRELQAIRHAAQYAEAGMAAALSACRAGASENEIAAAMTAAAITAGSEAMAMEPLISSGPRSGIPHATWRRRQLGAGDGIFLELAASHDRYHAAPMRAAWVGTPPDAAQRMMDTSLRALDAALAALRPGEPCAAPHEVVQQIIDAAGFTAAFRKRSGYSMGAAFAPDWGEGAILSLFTGVTTPLEPGMVSHLPITLRDYGRFTVGVSETVIVTETGAEPLSTLPRQITLC